MERFVFKNSFFAFAFVFFFFNDTATTEIYTLSLHDALPNSRRPGIGLKPRREGQRPLLPQHARHCPVLEAGSSAGHLVYPPLKPHEAFHVVFLGEGRYRLVYYLNPTGSQWDAIFSVTFV